ncbi:DUF7344 domain-containing protein [Halorussus salinisoli]|uniref:DUF7344 domain-containing protein n=1 Tax=Halorussus salinisoli TaxID=2558242 RepID=UPI0010C19CEF|nr:helix-turn-helix transcriptional regulator [Halorussus salinisoli]
MIGNRDDTGPPKASHARDETTVSAQELWGLLSDPIRRRLLSTLDPEEGRVTLSELAEKLADETPPDRIAIRLHHEHLPKLAEYGFVTYDAEENVVEAETTPEWVEPYLDL